jgi:hypothetical protein
MVLLKGFGDGDLVLQGVRYQYQGWVGMEGDSQNVGAASLRDGAGNCGGQTYH